MLIRIASQYQSPWRLNSQEAIIACAILTGSPMRIFSAMKRNRATEIAYRRVLMDFHGSGVGQGGLAGVSLAWRAARTDNSAIVICATAFLHT